MSHLTDEQLTEIRRVAQGILRQTCSIQRNDGVSDGMGGITDEWTTVQTNVPCRLAVRAGIFLAGDLRQRREMASTYAEYVLKVAVGTDIRAADRVVVDGETYHVESIWDEHEYASVIRCKMTRLS
jgi:head-tail adaptor